MEFKDYYQVMGVSRDATKDEIKRSYRKLARRYHPDVSKEADAEERFKEVGEAYEVLGDPEKRAAYDQFGQNWREGQDFSPPPDWDQGFEFHGGNYTDANASQFSDFFESLFGDAHRQSGYARQDPGEFHARGLDTHAKISIDLEDAYRGAQRLITLKHAEYGPDGRPVLKERNLNVRIPKGVRQGQHIRLTGEGESVPGSTRSGDLYLEVEFNPHSLFQIEGSDVYLDLPITPWEAALGCKLKVPTPEGQVELSIPANSSNERKLRLRGKGIPAKTAGDFFVVLKLVLPQAHTEREKAAYETMKSTFQFNPRASMGV